MAMACVWSGHPEAFPQNLIRRLATRAVTVAFREPLLARGSWREHSGRADDEFATHFGYLLGELLWVRFGRLGDPRSFMPLPSELSEEG